ncbi:MAG TPA: bifunctional phosphoglucose/phosphomannose isomerase [Deltaproteobacteria bacterium]|nr:MAG: bifunctional phosphoglucose/phosphomannose isomerase [Deltaproteobacteria bacterium GWA2_45_12]HBF11907.1 bifunctional phosphoglucose/phosphomannose isomerase [Deltaproteobacteria bacterium]
MLSAIRGFPKQFEASLKILEGTDLSKLGLQKPRYVFFAGMGGSSLPADMVNDYLNHENPLRIVRDYQLPDYVNSRDWVICSSYSGNTEETIEAFHDAIAHHANLIVMAYGGKLKSLAQEKEVPFVQIPECIQPRCAVGNFFTSTLDILHALGLIKSEKDNLLSLARTLKKDQKQYEEEGKKIAVFLKGRVPIIYGPSLIASMCRIWKIKINENAKVQSFWNVYPELNHNEMVGYTKLLMQPAIVHLRTGLAHSRNLKRMDIVEELLGEEIPFLNLELKGQSILEVLFEANALGDYASYYLALEYGVDPAPVEMVESFKKKLER